MNTPVEANYLWQVISIVLVLTMQVGFLMLESGAVRERNTISVAQKNAIDFVLCWAVFFLFGYSIAFGLPSPLLYPPNNIQETLDFLFFLGFCAATATILSGAVAERIKLKGYMFLTLFIAGFVFPISTSLIWGNYIDAERDAYLASLGFIDFAGGTVVHATAAAVSLAAIMHIGSRYGRYDEAGNLQAIPGCSPVNQLLGCFILSIGWIGFNTGTLNINDIEFSKVLLNTLTASSFGALVGMIAGYIIDKGVFNPNRIIIGVLAGLVSVTAGAIYATSLQVILTAAIAVLAAMYTSHLLANKLKLDDPLDVVAIHGVAGIIGTIALTFYLNEGDLVNGSRLSQLWIQTAGSVGLFLFWFVISWLLIRIYSTLTPIRVSVDDEKLGLNFTENGIVLDGDLLKRSIRESIITNSTFTDADEVDYQFEPGLEASDITQALNILLGKQKKANEIIKHQSERFLHFASTTNDLLWETNENFELTLLQTKSSEQGRVNLIDVNEKSFFGSFICSNVDQQTCERCFSELSPIHHLEVKCRLLNTLEDNIYELNGVPFFDYNGKFKGYRGGASDLTEQKFAQQKVDFLAYHDSLTQLRNRQSLKNRLFTIDKTTSLAIILVDLCAFSDLNETDGPELADSLLQVIAKQFTKFENKSVNIYRLSADVFALLAMNANVDKTKELVDGLCDQVIDLFQRPFNVDNNLISINACIGVSFKQDELSKGLLSCANIALKNAKCEGPGTVIVFDQKMSQFVKEQEKLTHEIDMAFTNKQFELYYQPKCSVQTSALTSFEALIRWDHPTRGILSPFYFLETIEKMGRLEELGDWVIKEACEMAATWPDDSIGVAINIAPIQLKAPNFPAHVASIVAQTGLAFERLELELLEEALMTSLGQTTKILSELRKLGFSIAIDDFGCGSTSLQYLYKLPASTLKIDRSFISGVCENDKAKEIAHSIVKMARKLNLKVVAEGVEIAEQVKIIKEWNCDEAQGYFYSKPLSAGAAMEYCISALNTKLEKHLTKAES